MTAPPDRAHGAAAPVVARPSAWSYAVGAVAAGLVLIVGVVLPLLPFEPAAVDLRWIQVPTILFGLIGLVGTAGPLLRYRIEIHPDGRLIKQAWRRHEVELRHLAALPGKGNHPYGTGFGAGYLGVRDRHQREAFLPFSTYVDLGSDHWEALVTWIEGSGVPLGGVAAAKLAERVGREVRVGDANRGALARAEELARAGRAEPSTTRSGLDERAGIWWLYAGVLLLLTLASLTWQGEAAGLWTLALALGALACGVVPLLRLRNRLEVSADGVLHRVGIGAGRVSLREPAAVELHPDKPYLELEGGGRHPLGKRRPTLVVRDRSGAEVRVALGPSWLDPVPALRSIYAAANTAGLALSDPTRANVERLLGLAQLTPGPTRPHP
jgi:hypothetical protein